MNNNYAITSYPAQQEKFNSYVIIGIGNKKFAVNIENVLEVTGLPELETPQTPPENIVGIMNYKDVLINVVDLCPILGLQTVPFSVNDKLVIVYADGNCFAILANSIINIIKVNVDNIQNVPFTSDNFLIKTVYNYNDENINIIDVAAADSIISKNISKKGHINYQELLPSDDKSCRIMKERAAQIKKQHEGQIFSADIEFQTPYILFKLGEQYYLINLKYVKEFVSVRTENITKLPYTYDFIKGLMGHKGDFLVVLDLNMFLNNEPASFDENSKLIIIQGKNFNIAFLVDKVKYIKNLRNIFESSSYNFSSEYISFEFIEDSNLYNVLNVEKILCDERIYLNTDMSEQL